jgi:hypothetical protein
MMRQDKIFEFQIGQIDHASDGVELLCPLLAKLEVGIKKLQPNNNAMCTATLVVQLLALADLTGIQINI